MSMSRLRNRFDLSIQSLRHGVLRPLRDRLAGRALATRDDILFIHIPKTAGISVHHALALPDRGHCRFSEFPASRRSEAATILFSLRDPFDRLLSMHRYLKQLKRDKPVRGRLVLNLADRDFASFLNDPCLEEAAHAHYFYRSQFDYLAGVEAYAHKLVMLRTERLTEDMETAFQIAPERLNRSSDKLDDDADTPANRKHVRQLYCDDYDNLPALLDRCGLQRPDWMG